VEWQEASSLRICVEKEDRQTRRRGLPFRVSECGHTRSARVEEVEAAFDHCEYATAVDA